MAVELNTIDDGSQLLEGAAHLASLSRHGFQQERGGLFGRQYGIQDLGNKLNARIRPLALRESRGEC